MHSLEKLLNFFYTSVLTYIRALGKWNNFFATTLKVKNTSQANLAVTDVFGEYMNEGYSQL